MPKRSKPQSSKRVELAVRFFTYGVMAVATIVLTTLAIFYALGYRFNQTNLSIEQGGLVQLRSTPEDANVYVDGVKINPKTPGRAYLSAGTHTVEMQLEGYHTWRRTFELHAGQLLWLDYPRLVPNTVVTDQIHALPSVSDAAFSPDRRWVLTHESPGSLVYTLLDLSDETKPEATNVTIPEAQVTLKNGKVGTLSIMEWDFGSHGVLIRHDNEDVHEVLRLDRTRPNEAVNVSRLFSLNINEAHFAGGNQNVLYVQTDGVLRRLDIGAPSASAALVQGVAHFTIYGEDQIAFVSDRDLVPGDGSSRRTVAGLYQNGKEVFARTYAVGTPLSIALTEYFRHQYLALSQGDGVVEILRDPAEKATETPALARFELDKPVAWLTFSSNGRMLAAGNGNTWATHDLEIAQTYNSTLDGAEATKPFKWLDDYYLWTDAGDRLRFVEFDGQNPRDIASLTSGYMVSLSQNGKVLFSFGKNDAGAALQASQFVVD